MIRSIQNRIILLIALIGVVMIVGIILSQQVDRLRIQSMLENKKVESSKELTHVVDFKSKSLVNFSYDYTFWDEMVNFTNNVDLGWAKDNIEVSLPTFDVNYAWVFGTDLKLLYSIQSAETDQMMPFPLLQAELKELVGTGAFYNFYVLNGSVLIQVSGGSIHPSSDPGRLTPPSGYFFLARAWNPGYVKEIEEFTETRISVLSPVNNTIPPDSITPDKFGFVNYKPLEGWNGNLQACLQSTGSMEMARSYENRSRTILIVLSLTLFLVLGFVSFILITFVNRPLRALIYSLMSDSPEPIRGLIKKKSEFGHIAQLMSDFFIQKSKLMQEIEERVKVEKELILAKNKAEESDRLKSAFLNNISHEIRTPMNAIIGFSELVTDPRISDQERLEFTGIISESSYRLLGIITDLISISTIDSGQMVIDEEKINLNSLLHGIRNQIKKEIDSDNITLTMDLALKDSHSFIHSDENKLTQVVTNLLKNSAKFTKSGKIDFGYSIRNGVIEFFISDTGIGISPEKYETIFARFQQADDSMSRTFGGTGLGLPIAKAYVELMGGRLWFKSEVGVGTQFYFTIPYKPA